MSPIKADPKPEPIFAPRPESPDFLDLPDPALDERICEESFVEEELQEELPKPAEEPEVVVVKKRDQPAKSSLSELAAQIRKNIDSMPDEKQVPKVGP